MKRSVYLICLLATALLPALAGRAEDEHSHAQVYLGYEAVSPGERVPVAVKITVAEGWHTYAEEPGDSGMPPSITVSGLDGLQVAEWRFPPAETFTDSIGTTYGYEDQVVLLSEMLIPETIKEGSQIRLTAKLNWMICRDICVFQTGSQTLLLRVESGAPMELSSEWKRLLEESRWESRSKENE